MGRTVGFEPTTPCATSKCSANWAISAIKGIPAGLEPATTGLSDQLAIAVGFHFESALGALTNWATASFFSTNPNTFHHLASGNKQPRNLHSDHRTITSSACLRQMCPSWIWIVDLPWLEQDKLSHWQGPNLRPHLRRDLQFEQLIILSRQLADDCFRSFQIRFSSRASTGLANF